MNKKSKEQEIILENDKHENIFIKGYRTIKDLLAPASIERTSPDELKVENKYVRTFVINGYPSTTHIGFLTELFDTETDIDTAIYIEPADDREAQAQLTKEISIAEAQLMADTEKGKISNLTFLQAKRDKLVAQRERLEQNTENMFYVQVIGAMYSDSLKELNKNMQKLDNRLIGSRIKMMPLYLRQDDGYKSSLPYGRTYINDYARNINTGALTGMFPFYNAEISHPGGTFMGINQSTATAIFLDWYNKSLLNNANGFVFGTSGSGKTYFVSLLTLRSAIIDGVRTVVIDAEGEYGKVTNAVGGIVIKFEPTEKFKLNCFDIEAEPVIDDLGNNTGEVIVDIKSKAADILNLIAVMSQGTMTPDIQSGVSEVIKSLYTNIGITENPDSLYTQSERGVFNKETGEYSFGKIKKKMPQMTDFYNGLVAYAKKRKDERFFKLADTLKMFVEGGIYDMFDCQTTMNIDFDKAPVVSFDVSKLEENLLRPIGMYIALNWTWETFAKQHVEVKKRILVDEAWLLIRKSLKGSEYTGLFLENTSTRIRKRNGGLVISSQRYEVFNESENGQAILTNSAVKIFFKQESANIKGIQDTFMMSAGERSYLLGLQRGEYLIKVNGQSSKGYAYSFDFEDELIGNAELKKTGYIEEDDDDL